MLEKEIRRDILKALDEATYITEAFIFLIETGGRDRPNRKVDQGGREAGAPDIFMVYQGRAVALEVKRPGKKQNESQVKFQTGIVAAGGIYKVVHSPKEAMAVLEQLKGKES